MTSPEPLRVALSEDELVARAASVLRQKWNLWPADSRRMAADLHRAGLLAVATRDTALRARIEAERADAAYRAMWSFFLRLPSPTPFSDMVQREAIRLRAVLDPAPHQQADAGLGATTEETQHG